MGLGTMQIMLLLLFFFQLKIFPVEYFILEVFKRQWRPASVLAAEEQQEPFNGLVKQK